MTEASSVKNIIELTKLCTLNGNTFKDIVQKREIIPISPSLDYVLGGGIREGSFILMTGVYKGGKTATALSIAAEAQKQLGYDVVILDAEHRLSARDLCSIPNLNIDNVTVITSTEEHFLTSQDFLQLANHHLTVKKKQFVIIDSISSMCSRELRAGQLGEKFRDSVSHTLSQFTRLAAPAIAVQNNIFLAITHEVSNTGPGYSTVSETGGKKIQYAHDFKLRVSHITPVLEGEIKVGQDIHWECKTSSLGPPGRKCSSRLIYNHGLDDVHELLSLAKEAIIPSFQVKTSWYIFGEEKIQGEQKAIQYVRDNPQLLQKIKEETYERYQLCKPKVSTVSGENSELTESQ